MSFPDPESSHTLQDILAQRRRRRLLQALVLLALCLAGVIAWWFLQREPPPQPAPPPVVVRESAPPKPVVPAPPPKPAPEPAPEPAPPPLPELDRSDSEVRGRVETLTPRHELAAWLVSKDLIRRFVTSVDNIAEGKSPREQLDSMWPTKSFKANERETGLYAEPVSYARYDLISDIFNSLDTAATVALYRRLTPLIDEAYTNLGYPDQSFDDALARAFKELLRTPVLVGEPELLQGVLSFRYADPELEGLSAAQKQLLRMGPTNAPRVQRKLREFARALGIPDRELPPSEIYKVKVKTIEQP